MSDKMSREELVIAACALLLISVAVCVAVL